MLVCAVKPAQAGEQMKGRILASVSVLAGLVVALTANHAAAVTAEELVGAWTPVSNSHYGGNPKGIAMFDANGNFAIELFRVDLPNYASNVRTQGTPEEHKATVHGSLAYYGTYKVQGTDLLLHVKGSTFPNWRGARQKRTNLKIEGDKLTWTQPAPSGGGGPTMAIWQRPK